jgi:hypothetical protein
VKTALLLCSIILPLAATAQKLQASAPASTYHIGSEKTFLYRTPADTAAGKSSFFLYPDNEAVVVGEFSPRWVVVKREGFLYLAPTSKLRDYNSARLAADRAADAAALPVDPQTHLITYQGVVEIPGISKADLYTRAYAWIANAYHSANAVIQMQDKEAGQLVAKGLTRVNARALGMTMDAGIVRHTLTIYVKDGRYKYVLTNLTHEDSRPKAASIGPLEQEALPFGYSKKAWAEIKADANRDAYRLVSDLQAAMTLKGAKDPSDF